MSRDLDIKYVLESQTVSRDLIEVLLGRKIGSGMSRNVYECNLDKSLVVKVEIASHSFQNVIEWELWENISSIPHVRKWFAPCHGISPCGTVLLQKKVEKPYRKDFPKQVPYFFRDLKYDNYGMLNGKLVCCDYGTFLREDHFDTKRMKKADWWE